VGHDPNDPMNELKEQKRIEDILLITNPEGDNIGSIKYQANWVYNKKKFMQDLIRSMEEGKQELINEIKNQDRKL